MAGYLEDESGVEGDEGHFDRYGMMFNEIEERMPGWIILDGGTGWAKRRRALGP